MTIKKRVIVATDNQFATDNAKTAHGLIRGSDRFEVLAIIDAKYAGQDAGKVLDGTNRNIPIFNSVVEAKTQFNSIDYLIVGVATSGGIFSQTLLETVSEAIRCEIGIVNGLHDQLARREDIAQLALKNQVELIDIRTPKPVNELHFWTGEILKVDVPILAVLGTDCSLGKRTTARLIIEACAKEGIHGEMIFTGQTGWLQGVRYGFILDSTLNDFVSGELEYQILNCWKKERPELIILEGQSSLRNPSGPCGLELLISGNAKHVVLVHAPGRVYYDDSPEWGSIPNIESEISIIEKFGAKVIAVALNTKGLTIEEAHRFQTEYTEVLGIPVVLPLENGINDILLQIKSII